MKPPHHSATVAVVDIGSNSIKLLVAARAPDGVLAVRSTRTLDVRISAGLGQTVSRLSDDGIAWGTAAVQTLLHDAAAFAPARTVVVATSAVRDAKNGSEFRERLRAATGQAIRILTGDEEARLIGRGLTCDPALSSLQDFYVFDLGGGSLECLAFRQRQPRQAVSLPLGCVRLTERLVPDPTAPFSKAVATQVSQHCIATIEGSGFSFALPAGATAVGTGGTVTTVRAILAAKRGIAIDDTSPDVPLDLLREQLREVGALALPQRTQVPGLPAARADVFPTALATIIAVAERGHFAAYRHSFYNLRYGLAAEALETR
jgi:exopolyphosphatase/guanosine-5'-triphosphate,3'-diphosphate pyrophosphatase